MPELLFCRVIFEPQNAVREQKGDGAAYRNPPVNTLISFKKKKKKATSERNYFIDLINSSKSSAGLLILCMFFIVL